MKSMKKKSKQIMFFLLGLVVFASNVIGSEAMDLTTELQKTPLGIDTPNPRFSWKMKKEEGKRGQAQTAYRILVATDPAKLKDGRSDVWDSKVIKSSESVLVEGGKNFQPKTRYYWTVQIWDETNKAGGYAEPTWFETGMPVSKDWDDALWIKGDLDVEPDDFSHYWQKGAVLGAEKQLPKNAKVSRANLNRYHSKIERSLDQCKPATYFRKEFALKAKPVRAR
ncbi:MAG: glycoside hydrolase family 78 protein, partial [Planctomycetota bacterium]